MDICKPPMWEDLKNPDTLVPCKFTEDIICLIQNTPQGDDFLLQISDEPYTNEYDDDNYTEGDNNEYS